MTDFNELVSIILKMLVDGSETHEIFEKLSNFGLSDEEIDKIYNATVEMIASGSDSTEIIFNENYNRRRRIFIEDEVETLKSVPGLLQSYLWGDIEEADFERTLSDLSSFDE
ncbi:MAG: hypothetical protein FXF54_07520 [Kosmotoga sp.]|nr:MAG: hypothetical protein FXF54_07520 [Kosmotoga sp.]